MIYLISVFLADLYVVDPAYIYGISDDIQYT